MAQNKFSSVGEEALTAAMGSLAPYLKAQNIARGLAPVSRAIKEQVQSYQQSCEGTLSRGQASCYPFQGQAGTPANLQLLQLCHAHCSVEPQLERSIESFIALLEALNTSPRGFTLTLADKKSTVLALSHVSNIQVGASIGVHYDLRPDGWHDRIKEGYPKVASDTIVSALAQGFRGREPWARVSGQFELDSKPISPDGTRGVIKGPSRRREESFGVHVSSVQRPGSSRVEYYFDTVLNGDLEALSDWESEKRSQQQQSLQYDQ